MVDTLGITALILAGGEGSRMGGVDKGLQLYQGSPLVKYAVQLVKPLVADVVVSANRNIDSYREFCPRVITDGDTFRGIGPLAGILTAVEVVDTSHILILPCDTPGLSQAALSKLIACTRAHPSQIHFLATKSGAQPLHAILPVMPVRHALKAFLATSDHYGVMKFYRDFGCEKVMWELEDELDNINFADQLKSV